MQYRKRIKKILWSSCIFVFLLCGMSMMGCSSQNSLVGTWQSDESDYTRVFYEDGTCVFGDGDEIIKYKQQEDGTLMFMWGLLNERIIKRADDKEQALENDEYYYLSGNTLVLYGSIYERK